MAYTPLQMAEAFIHAGELSDALDALDQQPGDEARRLRAAVLLRLDQPQAALAELAQVATPTAQDHVQRSVMLERGGDMDGALAAMQAARGMQPENERMTERVLNLLLARNDLQAALALVREQPRTWRWLQWEGDVLVLLGDDQKATAHYGLALAQLEAQHDPAAVRYVTPALARLLLARAHAYRRLDDLDSAEAHYTAAAQLVPDEPAIPFYHGLLLAQRGDAAGALALCREALEAAPPVLRDALWREIAGDGRYGQLAQGLA